MLLFDAHLDLAFNALDYNRDLRMPVGTIRSLEAGQGDRAGRGAGTVALPEMRRGGIGICVATLLAPTWRPENPIPGWRSPEQAWAQILGQLAWYQVMESEGEVSIVRTTDDLARHVALWSDDGDDGVDRRPVGLILSLEGADPIVSLDRLGELHAAGLRAVGPAHYGAGRFANGTDATGGLPDGGRDLVREIDRLGMILDATHLCDESLDEALELFGGPVWASHSNCRSLVPHNRQFSDDQIRRLIGRGAVIGSACDAWMLAPGWIRGKTRPESAGVGLTRVADHIDHVCQVAGDARHAGIGSDLDGGFGREQSPADLDTIADLGTLAGILEARGFGTDDIAGILAGNFLRFLHDAWT